MRKQALRELGARVRASGRGAADFARRLGALVAESAVLVSAATPPRRFSLGPSSTPMETDAEANDEDAAPGSASAPTNLNSDGAAAAPRRSTAPPPRVFEAERSNL
jgi:hypothetical protein